MKFIIAIWEMLKSKFSQEMDPLKEMERLERKTFRHLPKKYQEKFLNPPDEIFMDILVSRKKLFDYRYSVLKEALKELGEEVQV